MGTGTGHCVTAVEGSVPTTLASPQEHLSTLLCTTFLPPSPHLPYPFPKTLPSTTLTFTAEQPLPVPLMVHGLLPALCSLLPPNFCVITSRLSYHARGALLPYLSQPSVCVFSLPAMPTVSSVAPVADFLPAILRLSAYPHASRTPALRLCCAFRRACGEQHA